MANLVSHWMLQLIIANTGLHVQGVAMWKRLGEDPAFGLLLESRPDFVCLCLGKDACELEGVWDRPMEMS